MYHHPPASARPIDSSTFAGSVDVLPERQLAIGILPGRVSGALFMSLMDRLYGDERWQPGFATLWDWTRVAYLDFSPQDMKALRHRLTVSTVRRGNGKLAFVASREMDYHLCQLFCLFARSLHRPANAFWRYEDALEWLRA